MASFSEINYQTQLSTASDISSRLDSQYIRLGNNATVLALNTDKSIAIGNSAAAFGSSIAVGNETSAGNRSTSYKYSTAIGFRAKCDGMHSMQLGNSSGKLSSDYTLRFKDCVIATGTSSDDIKIPVTSLSGLDEKFITLSNSLSVKLQKLETTRDQLDKREYASSITDGYWTLDTGSGVYVCKYQGSGQSSGSRYFNWSIDAGIFDGNNGFIRYMQDDPGQTLRIYGYYNPTQLIGQCSALTGKDPTSVDPLENDLGGPYVISAGTAAYTLTYTPLNAKVYEPTGRYFTTGVMNSRTETSSFALSTGVIELSGMVPDLDSDEFRKLIRHEVCNVISSAFAAHTLSDMTFVDIINIFRNLSAD